METSIFADVYYCVTHNCGSLEAVQGSKNTSRSYDCFSPHNDESYFFLEYTFEQSLQGCIVIQGEKKRVNTSCPYFWPQVGERIFCHGTAQLEAEFSPGEGGSGLGSSGQA